MIKISNLPANYGAASIIGVMMGTPDSGRHHVVWGLKSGVCKSLRARSAPLRYLAAIEEGYRQILDGDPGYADVLTKNPLHPSWEVLAHEDAIRLYNLDEL